MSRVSWKKMGYRVTLFLLFVWDQTLVSFAQTNSGDLAALLSIRGSWRNLPPNWVGADPCGSNWEGVNCTNTSVTSLELAGMGVESSGIGDVTSLSGLQYLDLSNNLGLRGALPSSVGNLRNLTILILVSCSFSGTIPNSIGTLSQLVYLSLNSNNFIGSIPSSIGNLSSLSWLDLSMNNLSGTIPVSTGAEPGLNQLLHARHFHFSGNQLSGQIPARLFSSNMNLIHAIFDNNQLTGQIPDSLGYVQTLEVIRFDSNNLDGAIPSILSNLTSLSELYLSNNNFNGSIPDLTSMNSLFYVDMSNNSFNASEVPQWCSTLQSLTTLRLENTGLQGPIPVGIFSLPQLETLVLSSNNLNGSLDIGNSYPRSLTADLQNNSITSFAQGTNYNLHLTLTDNPICNGNGATARYCGNQVPNNGLVPSVNCGRISCRGNEVLSPSCRCSNPYTGTMSFFSVSFTDFSNSTYYSLLNSSILSAFLSRGVPVDSIILSNPMIGINSFLRISVQMFPYGEVSFNRTSVASIGFLLNRQPFQVEYYGPFFFIDEPYCCFPGSRQSMNLGAIIGAAVGGSILVLLIFAAVMYALRQRKRAQRALEKNNPFAAWNLDKESGSVPQLHGSKCFSYEDLSKCTDNFSESNCIGSGGYGKVYKGTDLFGQVVAIKRAEKGSMQGALEFKTEIELLSRIHHKNVVSLVGFCYEQGDQMLVYEYISNGTLRDCLSGKTGLRLNWNRRMRIALDAARGLSYLHELADPPIIHRDVKSANILLDNKLNAKVADFGLSKLVGDTGKGYISTQVKGTFGYLDPEYYMTQQLTEKSDVYSFGIVVLELITGKPPIQNGMHIVKVVQEAMAQTWDPQRFKQIIDPKLESGSNLFGIHGFIEMAMSCIRESASERPTMHNVVREIESIMEMTGADEAMMNSVVSSSSYGETTEYDSPVHSHVGEGLNASYGSFPFHSQRSMK